MSAAARDSSSVPTTTTAPATSTSNSSASGNVGPGLQLAPLRSREDRGERERDARPELKDERDRRNDEHEPWGHAPIRSAPSALGGMGRSDRGRKRLSIGSMLADEH